MGHVLRLACRSEPAGPGVLFRGGVRGNCEGDVTRCSGRSRHQGLARTLLPDLARVQERGGV